MVKKQPHEAKNQVLDVEKNSFPAIRKEFWDVEYVDVTSDAAMSRASDIWSAELKKNCRMLHISGQVAFWAWNEDDLWILGSAWTNLRCLLPAKQLSCWEYSMFFIIYAKITQ